MIVSTLAALAFSAVVTTRERDRVTTYDAVSAALDALADETTADISYRARRATRKLTRAMQRESARITDEMIRVDDRLALLRAVARAHDAERMTHVARSALLESLDSTLTAVDFEARSESVQSSIAVRESAARYAIARHS